MAYCAVVGISSLLPDRFVVIEEPTISTEKIFITRKAPALLFFVSWHFYMLVLASFAEAAARNECPVNDVGLPCGGLLSFCFDA